MRKILLVIVMVLGCAAPAEAALRQQVLEVPASSAGIDPPSIAVGSDGTQTVAWATSARGYVAIRRPHAKRFGSPIALAKGARVPRAVVLRGARVLVTMLVSDRSTPSCCTIVGSQIIARGRRRAAPLQPVSVRGVMVDSFGSMSGGGGPLAAVAIPASGIALADARGRFGAPVARGVTPVGTQVAVGPSGRGAAVWVEGDRYTRLVGASLAPGRIGPSRTLMTADADNGFAFFNVAAAADAGGRVTVLSTHSGGTTSVPSSIRVGVTSGAGSLRGVQTLEQRGLLGNGFADLSLAVAPSGPAMAAWRAVQNLAPPGAQQTVRIALRRSAGARFRIVASLANCFYPKAAALASGGGAIVYSSGAQAVVRRVRSSGGLGAPQALSEVGGGSSAIGVAAQATGAHRVTLAYATSRGLSLIDLTA